jgi:hypothetical protein
MNWSKMTNDEILIHGAVLINNSLSDEQIQTAVAGYGYTAEKLNTGKQLLTEAETLNRNQTAEYGEQRQAQNAYDEEKYAANQLYIKELRIARVALKNDVQAIKTLGLEGRRKKAIADWIQQALNFYRLLLNNEEWTATMANFGQTTEILTTGLEKVEAVSALYESLKKETGEAQNATILRNEQFAELTDWLGDYDEIAAIALEDQPQLLEKLGIVVKS